MELVLMRHGKAEKLLPGKTDFDRELTRDGRKQLKEVAPGLLRCLLPTASVEVWASPLVRAKQTGRLVAEGIGHVPLIERKALQSGNLQELAKLWQGLPSNATLILVGHEPFLSEWCLQLTGVELPFKIAAAVGLEIKDHPLLRGKLRWCAHPAILARLGQTSK